MGSREIAIGITGGLGLGLLVGSEFHSKFMTVLGAVILGIALISMITLAYLEIK